VDTPNDAFLRRRMRRDVEERGRTPESVLRQYESTVLPSALAWARPSVTNADLKLDGAGALDWKVERVLTELHKRSLALDFPG
jgi:uridine kinase